MTVVTTRPTLRGALDVARTLASRFIRVANVTVQPIDDGEFAVTVTADERALADLSAAEREARGIDETGSLAPTLMAQVKRDTERERRAL